jgi:hypothetical protein
VSEFLAEAQVLIVPNTAAFAATLKTQLEAAVMAAGPVLVPVVAAGGIAPAQIAITKELAAEAQVLGATSQQAAAGTTALTRAQTLGVASAQKLAFAQAEVEGSASAASAAQISFTRSTAAVVAAQNALTAARSAGDATLIATAANTLKLAEAQHTEALTALEAARAQAVHAASLSQARRAFLAQAAAGAGLRGAVLASTAVFIGATVAAVAVGKSIKAASDLNEEINKTNEVFDESAKTILNWSETTGQAIGIARVEALRSIGTFGELFRTLGVGTPQAAELSQTLVELSADLASFFNAVPEDVLRALQSGLVGQARPLRQFGIFLTEARVKQEALAQSGKKSAESLTQQEKILARYNLILRDSAIAQGDFQRTQDQLANQSRILRANIEDLGGKLGSILLPAVLLTIEGLNDFINTVRFAGEEIGDLAQIVADSSPVQFVVEFVKKFQGGGDDGQSFWESIKAEVELGLGAALIGVGVATSEVGIGFALAAPGAVLFSKGMKDMREETEKAIPVVGNLDAVFIGLIQTLGKLKAAFEAAALAGFTSLLEGLEVKALEIQTGLTPGGRSAEEENLRQQIELDKGKVAASKKGSDARKEALRELKADQDALAALMAKDAADAKAAASEMERSSREAQDARDRQFQALADAFAGRQQRIHNALTRAALTAGLQDDLNLNKALIAALKKERDVLLARLKALKVSFALRKKILQAINQAIFDAQTDQIRLQQEQEQAQKDAAATKLDLRIRLAEARGDVAGQIKAHRAKLAAIQAELRKLAAQHKKNTVEWLRLKVAEAEEQKAIEELEAQTKTRNNAAREAIFEFLQAQQGFAANLLGNLIPGFATSGLVGGSGGQGGEAAAVPRPTGERPGGVQGAPTPERGVQGEAAKAEGRERGVSAGQGSTQIQLLRDIKRLLVLLNSRTGHPEAKQQKRTSNAAMDGVT